MNSFLHRTVLVISLAALAACGVSEATVSGTLGDDDFVRVARTAQALSVDAGTDGYASAGNENFYLAINKAQLGQKWFLSAYLTKWHPAEAGLAARSLGTRVVTFKVQNDRLYVFDVTNGATWSDTLDPQRVIEAYPLVKTFAPFNALPGASNYVLFDPSAGLNRFDVVGDDFAASFSARFEVELSYLQRYRALSDGISFEQVFTGYTEVPGPGVLGFDQPFRGQGTLAIALRKYAEGTGFVAQESTGDRRYFNSGNVQYVPNQPRLKQNQVKWNIKPGMQPIPWRISQAIATLEADPRLAGIDVRGAIAKGITGWNDAFGFPVFTVVPTGADDSYGDDDKNFVVVDTNPGLGLAFANWRENPNTGEIRGASVYFSSVFLEAALRGAVFADADAGVDAGVPVELDAGVGVDAGSTVDAGDPFFDPFGLFDAGVRDAGPAPTACDPSLVISQVYGGNGATSWRNQDFVVIHNRSGSPVSLSGMSLQYGSANGTSAWQVVTLGGTVPANGSYLVGFAGTADGGTPIPAPDQSSLINLSANAGKLALAWGTTAFVGACPGGTNLLDAIAYGTVNCPDFKAAPSPGITQSVIRRDLVGCVDTNDSTADFVLSTQDPKNRFAAADAPCTCTASTPVSPVSTTADGGVAMLPPPNVAMRPNLRWGQLSSPSVCALEAASTALIPAGMTRKEFIEKSITELILHEVGHTLGLRHNFKGSLEQSSVMDYNVEADAIRLDTPGPYDVAAVKFLYGLSTTAPTQAFCTDEDTAADAQCERYDVGSNPLTTDVTPAYRAALRAQLTEQSSLTWGQLHRVTRYVRGAANEAQRLEAFNALVADTAPPLSAEVVALGPNAALWADYLNAVLLRNLFVDPLNYRDDIGVNPSLNDAAFRARVVQVARDSLLGSDGHRSLPTMRAMVDVLKAMQHADALNALTQARATWAASRNSFPSDVQPSVDDLIRRMDLAMSPYFQ